MSLRIETNCMSNRAGSTVTGTVYVHHDGPFAIDHLAITLSGRAQTDIDQSTRKHPGCIFQGRRLLFATRKTLVKDSTAVQGPCSWAFELQFPNRCTAREAHAFRQWNRFDSNPQQRLPPPFASYSSGANCSTAANAAIIYELRASAVVQSAEKLETVEPINFTTTRDIEHPRFCKTAAQAQVVLQSARILPKETQKRLHVPRILKVAASSKPPPFAAFELVLRGSRAAIIGQSFPLDLSIIHDEPTSPTTIKPRVFLSHLEITLKARTSIRCSGSRCYKEKPCALLHKGDEFEDWEEEIQIDSSDLKVKPDTSSTSRTHLFGTSSTSSGVEIPIDDGRGQGRLDLHQHITIPTYIVPSFRSFIISRSYNLVIDLVVQCAGKSFPSRFVTRNFLLLAQEYAPRPSLKVMGSERTSRTLVEGHSSGVVLVPKMLGYA
ncbi:MAG: hypothetical protein Q9218_000579 [Villophora microphyllina]